MIIFYSRQNFIVAHVTSTTLYMVRQCCYLYVLNNSYTYWRELHSLLCIDFLSNESFFRKYIKFYLNFMWSKVMLDQHIPLSSFQDNCYCKSPSPNLTDVCGIVLKMKHVDRWMDVTFLSCNHFMHFVHKGIHGRNRSSLTNIVLY